MRHTHTYIYIYINLTVFIDAMYNRYFLGCIFSDPSSREKRNTGNQNSGKCIVYLLKLLVRNEIISKFKDVTFASIGNIKYYI